MCTYSVMACGHVVKRECSWPKFPDPSQYEIARDPNFRLAWCCEGMPKQPTMATDACYPCVYNELASKVDSKKYKVTLLPVPEETVFIERPALQGNNVAVINMPKQPTIAEQHDEVQAMKEMKRELQRKVRVNMWLLTTLKAMKKAQEDAVAKKQAIVDAKLSLHQKQESHFRDILGKAINSVREKNTATYGTDRKGKVTRSNSFTSPTELYHHFGAKSAVDNKEIKAINIGEKTNDGTHPPTHKRTRTFHDLNAIKMEHQSSHGQLKLAMAFGQARDKSGY